MRRVVEEHQIAQRPVGKDQIGAKLQTLLMRVVQHGAQGGVRIHFEVHGGA